MSLSSTSPPFPGATAKVGSHHNSDVPPFQLQQQESAVRPFTAASGDRRHSRHRLPTATRGTRSCAKAPSNRSRPFCAQAACGFQLLVDFPCHSEPAEKRRRSDKSNVPEGSLLQHFTKHVKNMAQTFSLAAPSLTLPLLMFNRNRLLYRGNSNKMFDIYGILLKDKPSLGSSFHTFQ